jgi:protein arginine kinase
MKKIDDFILTPGKWLDGSGPHSDIVVSSRIRLARNLDNFVFPHRSSSEELDDIINIVVEKTKNIKKIKNPSIYKLKDLPTIDREILVERHIMSHEMTKKDYAMVVVSEEEDISILVNEEDHLRFQVMASGLQLKECWHKIEEIEEIYEKELKFAFSSEFGYLTACPTNVGTGMRASVLVHLPALVITKHINQVLKGLDNIGMAIRGYYGEGTDAIGNFYQISNQITLGKIEEDIVDNIDKIILQIIDNEIKAREILYNELKTTLEDQIYRAYGILKNARIISSNEATELLSTLKLGVDLNLCKDIKKSMINELLIFTQPFHLQKRKKILMEPKERDIARAQIIRSRLN